MNADLKDTDDSKTAWQRRMREERDCGVYYSLTNHLNLEDEEKENADTASVASSRHEQNKSSLINRYVCWVDIVVAGSVMKGELEELADMGRPRRRGRVCASSFDQCV
jgi:hypothetical protein